MARPPCARSDDGVRSWLLRGEVPVLIESFRTDFGRQKELAEKTIAQIPESALNAIPAEDANSIAMIVKHVGGNLTSRFTDFLTTDGEKPDRNRDGEFETHEYSRAQIDALWKKGWAVLEHTLAQLGDDDLGKTVTIRSEAMSVHRALTRSLAHISYHVGQIVLLGRMSVGADWRTLSIPKKRAQ